jgi:hypothetical protein
MSISPAEELDRLYRTISRRHLKIYDTCPAVMNGRNGFLGISRGVYTRVWFDTENDSTTLFSSFRPEPARQKFDELRQQYGN